MISTHRAAWRSWSPGWLVWLACLLVACGGDGGVGSGGTGAPLQGLAVGTVNGFGSVIVDGVTYDDRQAPVVAEISPGHDTPAVAQLGDRATISFSMPGVAMQVRVDAALAGPVASVGATALVVLGQTVQVNADPASGPVTQFGGGYASASDVLPGDSVEVQGFVASNAGTSVLQATRVDRVSPPDWLRVKGVVTGTASGQLSVGALTVGTVHATVLPAGAAVSVGETVSLLAASSSLAASGLHVDAAEVRVVVATAGTDIWVSGKISALDTQAKTLLLGTQGVRWNAAMISPDPSALVDGAYVQVHGTVAADGVLDASTVTVRHASDTDQSELTGDITGFNAAALTFVVRGTSVDASTAQLQDCPATGLADGLFVQVTGRISSTGVVATTVECQNEPSDATVEREGRASSVDTTAQTFTLTRSGGSSVAVHWTTTTFFKGVTPQTLEGKSVQIEGTFSGTTLVARSIEADD